MAAIAFDNSYARLPERFFSRRQPTPVADPGPVRVNHPLATLLGIAPQWLESPEGTAVLAGNAIVPGSEPIATQADTSLLRAEEGERPAGATVTTLDTSVVFEAFDASTGSVSFKPQEGPERSLVVRDPEMRAFVETLEPGDVVQVTLVEVIALVVDPMP